MKKMYNSLFIIIWGILFAVIPIFAYIIGGKKSSFPLLFIVIGLIAIGFGVKNMLKMLSDKKILKNGKDGIGTFISVKGYGSINDVPMYKIIFEFTDDNNNTYQVTTNDLYTINQVEIYQNLSQFKIKYFGEKATIVPVTGLVEKVKEKEICQYCGSKYVGSKCPNCGATQDNNIHKK